VDITAFLFNYCLKLVFAAMCGAIIGLERELSGKPAGLRTTILICVGSCLFVILSYDIAKDAAGNLINDPGRIAAQIVTGIGFLGAGAIIQSRGHVVGLTTAATIWVTASIGMAAGMALYPLAMFATLLILFTLFGLRYAETWLLEHVRQTYYVELEVVPDAAKVNALVASLRATEPNLEQVQMDRDPEGFTLHFTLRMDKDHVESFQTQFSTRREVTRFSMERGGPVSHTGGGL
jgi:putative Mg2+ transporter-C (MgtC) family protein